MYVSGRVEQPGAVTLPQGSSLVQAIDLAGGTKVLHGKVEFIRFTREGEIDRRIFGFKSDAPSGDYCNPVLMAGDVVRLRETALTKTLAVVNEITTPAIESTQFITCSTTSATDDQLQQTEPGQSSATC